jgi:hypothetical protein
MVVDGQIDSKKSLSLSLNFPPSFGVETASRQQVEAVQILLFVLTLAAFGKAHGLQVYILRSLDINLSLVSFYRVVDVAIHPSLFLPSLNGNSHSCNLWNGSSIMKFLSITEQPLCAFPPYASQITLSCLSQG